jgi:hypothetical protein
MDAILALKAITIDGSSRRRDDTIETLALDHGPTRPPYWGARPKSAALGVNYLGNSLLGFSVRERLSLLTCASAVIFACNSANERILDFMEIFWISWKFKDKPQSIFFP